MVLSQLSKYIENIMEKYTNPAYQHYFAKQKWSAPPWSAHEKTHYPIFVNATRQGQTLW